MTTAILIDDDANLRAGMRQMLSRYAPDISIIGEADSVQSGVETIQRLKPSVLFLDIQLTDGTGFDVLEQLAEINGKITSQVVFITAHEQYAIKAFRFSALDFLLKPVDPDELQKVILKIKNVLLGYTIPASAYNNKVFSKIRVYAQVKNLITLTKYTGFDPEIGGPTAAGMNNVQGVDRGYYPQAKSYMLGVNLQF